MSVAKVTEIISSSKEGFDDAVKQGIKRASKTLNGIPRRGFRTSRSWSRTAR